MRLTPSTLTNISKRQSVTSKSKPADTVSSKSSSSRGKFFEVAILDNCTSEKEKIYAQKLTQAIFDRSELGGLTLELMKGKVTISKHENPSFYVILDFGRQTWKKNVVSLRIDGLEGFEGDTFRASVSKGIPAKSVSGISSMFMYVRSNQWLSSEGRKLFYVLKIVDRNDGISDEDEPERLPIKTRKASRRSEADEEEGEYDRLEMVADLDKEPVKKKAALEIVYPESSESSSQDSSPKTPAEKGSICEDPKGKEEATGFREEAPANRLSSDVVTFMALNRKDLIDKTVAALTERYAEVVQKAIWAKAKEEDWEGQCRQVIAKKVAQEGWAGKYREDLEEEIRQEVTGKVKKELEEWAAEERKKAKMWVHEQWGKKKAELANLEEMEKESWRAKWAAAERQKGRDELMKELNQQALAETRKKAAQTPGLSEVDMAKAPSMFELNAIQGAVKNVRF